MNIKHDDKEARVGIFLDLSKAFNLVNTIFYYKHYMHIVAEELHTNGLLLKKLKAAGRNRLSQYYN